ncbi:MULTISPECIES: c-type cytochrome [unclassified Campylobacter]|uniref:c-type cytochrome n=1 Tax=unclassified Campylobacter TaxID=2593542 RepID=UPI0022E9B206|nr:MULTISPECIES: c-type cytochrome [unclassified Campylobacter]MDA3054510.1 c-type cytochrome [Campylobacter sp. VBCF_07 NA4]MDA3060706.1 c-type cytochrome [Campylobacter sp. VBCF_02 NA5]MDA3070028.1 c-type cytochrome [Campylobacter sp. VBCF_08 NA3]WBR54466.1 c-type cytochrome [Campylobacter sp. VBCF_01 NA2]
MKWLNLSDNVNVAALIASFILVAVTAFIVKKYAGQSKSLNETTETTGEDFDGIAELKNGLPKGWAICFVLMFVYALVYFFIAYPLNSYSQIGEYNDEVKEHNAKFEKTYANADSTTLKAMGESVYLVQCSQCHGLDGDGIDGESADLTKWGKEAGIIDAINKGSKGLNYPLGEMPAGMVSPEDAKAVAAFMAKEISSLKATKNENLVEKGRELWPTCAACHGDDGKGMDGSAPDLSKYGSAEFSVDVLNRGKKGFIGTMPAFDDGRLNDVQKRAVGEYINSIK